MAEKLDFSKISTEELSQIHNDVLKQLAIRVNSGANPESPHDSHSSSHGKNSIQFAKLETE